MNYFREAFDRTMEKEGGFSDNPRDAGGLTYMGISRIYWPGWPGWHIIDRRKKDNMPLNASRSGLFDMVESFYKINFWVRIQGDKVASVSPGVAYELFDTAVNLDVPDAVKFLQTALNMQREACRSFSELVVDGKLGTKTMIALALYKDTEPGDPDSNEEILLACLNGEQYIHYKNNPQHRYFRGWFLRV